MKNKSITFNCVADENDILILTAGKVVLSIEAIEDGVGSAGVHLNKEQAKQLQEFLDTYFIGEK